MLTLYRHEMRSVHRLILFWNSARVLANRQSLTDCLKNSRDVWHIGAYRSARAILSVRLKRAHGNHARSNFYVFLSPPLSLRSLLFLSHLIPSHFLHKPSVVYMHMQ